MWLSHLVMNGPPLEQVGAVPLSMKFYIWLKSASWDFIHRAINRRAHCKWPVKIELSHWSIGPQNSGMIMSSYIGSDINLKQMRGKGQWKLTHHKKEKLILESVCNDMIILASDRALIEMKCCHQLMGLHISCSMIFKHVRMIGCQFYGFMGRKIPWSTLILLSQ